MLHATKPADRLGVMPITLLHVELSRIVNASGESPGALSRRARVTANTVRNIAGAKRDVRLGNAVAVLAALGFELRVVKARRGGRQ